VLTFHRVNAGFNCCPGGFTVQVNAHDNVIEILEDEVEPNCHCLCLFDLDYEITGVWPGTYRIIIDGPYMAPAWPETEDYRMIFDVELTNGAIGDFCVQRSHYPWWTDVY
jgi:hypothetical protein